MNFTPTQSAAIETKGKNILVSASAGSGKTRVLVERVLRRLLAGENINEFLIVTFTEAAAAEMKERLEKVIRTNLQDAEGDQRQHLLKQVRLLNVANISTLHAFALRLIEQYHYTIDLDPQFRLLDDAERTLLMHNVYQSLLNDAYENDDTGTFKALVTQFKSASQDDGPLRDAVFTLFNFAMARPDTSEWLANLVTSYAYEGSFTQTVFYQTEVLPLLKQELTGLSAEAERALRQAPDTDESEAALNRKANLENDADFFDSLNQMLSNPELDWDTLRGTMLNDEQPTKWGAARHAKAKASRFGKDDTELKEAWDAVKIGRDYRLTQLDKLRSQYFVLDEEGQKVALTGAQETLRQLVIFTEQFREAFLKEKLAQKTVDFNDLEHFALEIVQQTPVVEELSARYSEVMVDEYQDTNQLQEAILSRIAGDDNTFQVGDIKQSIYKFRQADPSLFGSKLHDYPLQDKSDVITLQENFRSHPNVTKFINYIFGQIMSEQLGDVEYTGTAELVAGADYYPAEVSKHAELLVYLSDADGDADQYSSTIGQIRLMAWKIKELMADETTRIFDREAKELRRPTYDDFTILVPTKLQNLDVIDVFNQLDLPLAVDGTENFFQTTEISVMLSLLRVIDNPHQDIPLAAVLRSPMYGLDENALAVIRLQDMQGDFYQALVRFDELSVTDVALGGMSIEQVDKIKATVSRFIAQLAEFKILATQNQLVDLIWRIFDKTGWLDYMGGLPSGPQRQANLHALYERAASFQQSNFVGLYQFVSYITELQEKERDLGVADANVTDNSIRLMTIHRSKGLEFPIVFLLNSTRDMVSTNEVKGKILVDAYAGAGMDYIDVDHQLQLPTIQREVVKTARQKGAFAEQLRVLYVALTRAEQEVFLVGSYDTAKQMLDKWQLSQHGQDWMLPEWVRLQGKSYMDLAGMALLRHPDIEQRLKITDVDVDLLDIKPLVPKDEFAKPANEEEMAKFLSDQLQFKIETKTFTELQADEVGQYKAQSTSVEPVIDPVLTHVDVTNWQPVLQYDYLFDSATHATAYQSVSEVKRLFEDPDLSVGRGVADKRLDPQATTGLRFVNDELPEPKFMQVADNQVNAAAIGTGTHLVLQSIDLSQGVPTPNTIVQTIDGLVKSELLDIAVAQKINQDSILTFFTNTDLGQQMVMNQATLKREVPFSLLLDAKMLYQDFKGNDRVLVHGIIDGYFMKGDELWLFDYKTDRIQGNDAAQLLQKRYAGQLNIYAQALIAMGLPQPKKFIYALSTGQTIELA